MHYFFKNDSFDIWYSIIRWQLTIIRCLLFFIKNCLFFFFIKDYLFFVCFGLLFFVFWVLLFFCLSEFVSFFFFFRFNQFLNSFILTWCLCAHKTRWWISGDDRSILTHHFEPNILYKTKFDFCHTQIIFYRNSTFLLADFTLKHLESCEQFSNANVLL